MINLSEIIVSKSEKLKGKVKISGSKNAALPIIAASIAVSGKTKLKNIPDLSDVNSMIDILKSLGCDIERCGNELEIVSDKINNLISPYEMVIKLRASFLVSGAMLARFGYARISQPGGCAIGARPVDLHLKGFALMGATINKGDGYIELSAKRLNGASIYLDFPSVGATENLLVAACLAQGQTEIINAATEPEVADLARFLVSCGADIHGIGTEHIVIKGINELNSCEYSIIPDRIEAGTYMIASAITGGEILVENILTEHLTSVTAKLKEMGIGIIEGQNNILVTTSGDILPVDIKTMPHPGFPTDMQSLFSSLMCYANGTSIITETIFENRFMHMAELSRMHASIRIDGRSAVIKGGTILDGAEVNATDLRAGAALVLAGLSAKGTTKILNAQLIDRGYEHFTHKLQNLGANVEYVK